MTTSDPTRATLAQLSDATPAPAGIADETAFRAYFRRSRASLLAIVLTVVGMFLPVVIVPYAFSDDYSLLWMSVSGDPNPQFGNDIFAANATGGRPLAGLFQIVAYGAAGSIDNLRFVRFFGVLGVVGVGVLLHWALVRSRISPRVAAFIAILVCSLPAFQVYAAWVVENSMPWAMLLAAGASLLVVSAVDAPRHRVVDRLVGGCALFVAALLTYQPAAMYFWVFLAVALIGATRDSRRAMRFVVAHLGVAACAFVVTFVATKVFVHALGDAGTGGHRTELTHDVIGKARWFVEQPLYQALSLFKLSPSPLLMGFVAIVAVAGIVTWLVLNADRPLFLIAVALALVPLTYLPNLVVPDDWPPFRTQGALSSLLALYVCLGALGLWSTVRGWLGKRFDGRVVRAAEIGAIAVSVVFVGASVLLAATHVQTLIVGPQATELRLIRSQVRALPPGVGRVGFVLTDWHGGLITNVVYDEFGLPSSARPWAVGPAVDLILREQQPQLAKELYPPVDVYPVNALVPSSRSVIDLRARLPELRR